MMRHFLLIALTDVLLGFDLSLKKVTPTSKNLLYPSLNNLNKHPALSAWRRRSPRLSAECNSDIHSDSVWCIDPQVSCDVLGEDHTKWVIHIDHYNEHMCYPSSCSANDLEQLYTWWLRELNSAAQYCTFDCPAIKFDIDAISEDGERMAFNGMYRYADLSYDCAGAAAMVEISMCEETGACPNNTDGLTTCTVHFEDRTLAHLGMKWKFIGQDCFSNECITESNLEKLEDYHYAWLTHFQLEDNGVHYTPEEIRKGYLVEYSCPTTNPSSPTANPSTRNYSNYVLIFGVTSGALFLLCVLAICFLRIYRGGGVTMTPIVSVELNNRETFTRVCAISTSSM